jgi:hypothetical protein
MERWIIALFTGAILAGLAVLGWHYHRMFPYHSTMCTGTDAHCGDRPYFGSP